MGVPKFYRWVSERYPCLSEVVKEFQIPEFDNLYLDMNGIVHVCSHPEDDNPHFRITEEKIFTDIMYYIDFLFRMIKPQKVFFMAVDGVAPRAKMNQQRGRRFRSAREAEELEKRAREKGETLPTEKRFDSNCITPGTPFMVRLQEQLKYFVVQKVSQDPLWKGVRIYLSGHETPGEGEHKIMDFIRAERAGPGYDPNTRHCLYGLDADLMMLGLATHEPHFSLLREEVRFGKMPKHKSAKRPQTPEETTFHLLHLSLFREYLDFEFSALRDTLTDFKYNLENVIDDWVLMGFLVGNDFIPHLPNLHINHDALPLLWRTYMEVLPQCGGYINNGGRLNLERFEKYLAVLSKFDFDTFSEQAGDLKWLESKKNAASAEQSELLSAARKLHKNQEKSVARQSMNQFAMLDSLADVDDDEELGTELIPRYGEDPSDDFSEEFSEEDTLDDEFRHHKRNYYMTKMEYAHVTPEVLRDQAEGYVRGIQWILLYYYEGVPSWSWFYPHHYAPYMSDVKDFKDMSLTFDLGTPFLPFEQLMAVLPAASKDLLPRPYQSLMINDSSPVIDFYPPQFETDLNGKQQDWEAVVLIPFIDENRLLEAIRMVSHSLTEEEKSRNIHGPHLLYTHSETPGDPYPTSLPGTFPDIAVNHARLTKIEKAAFHLASSELRKGLLSGARLDVFYPGFPTLKHIPHKAELSKEGVKVFQASSRGYNMMLHVEDDWCSKDIDQVAKEYLGEEVYVNWPHLYEAKVVAVCDDYYSYTYVEGDKSSKSGTTSPRINRVEQDGNMANIWFKERDSIAERYKDRLGVVVGDTKILLRALPMTGRKYILSSHGRVTMEKQFGNQPVAFALQAIVKDLTVHDSSFCQFTSLTDYLPASCQVFMLGWPHYGCQGEVLDTDLQSGRVRINLSIIEEPKLSDVLNNQADHDEQYFQGYVLAQRLGISSHLFSRLTGCVFITAGIAEVVSQQQNPHRVNVGLNLKFTKRQEEVPGFTKLAEGNQWLYSNKCVEILKEYMKKFPEMFEILSKSDPKGNNNFYESEVIPAHCTYKLKDVQEYIKGLACTNVKSQKIGADLVPEGVILSLQRETDKIVEINRKRQKRIKMQVKPHLLFRPMITSGALIPDSSATYQLFDRVVNTRQGFSVPFGLRGTVVGIDPAEVEVNMMYEVLFDEDFAGGIAIRNSSMRGYRMPPSALLNLSHGQRKNGSKPDNISEAAAQNAYGKHRNVSQDYTYADASVNHSQGQGKGQQMRPGSSGYHDNRGGHNERHTGRGSDSRATGQRQHSGLVNKMVFNGASAGNMSPRFVTPKVSPGSAGRGSQRPANQNRAGASNQNSNASNSVFEDVWKQLQTSAPQDAAGDKGTSLAQASAVLPRVTSPENSKSTEASTKIDVQALFTQASKASDVGNKPSGSAGQAVTNNEFTAMLRSLEDTHVSVESSSHKKADDESLAIKKLLHMDEDKTTAEKVVDTVNPPKSYGRQLSVQELFEGAKKQTPMEPPWSEKHAQPRNNEASAQAKGPLPQQQHQQQQQQQQGGFQGKKGYSRPANLNPASHRNPVMELLTLCQSLQLKLPLYDYIPKNGKFVCVVSLVNGTRFQGSLCNSREEAAESAASVALLQMRGSMQQAAVMSMPGFRQQGLPQQGRQFSSANSAFSPVSQPPGMYGHQYPRGQFQGFQQQRPHYGNHSHQQNYWGRPQSAPQAANHYAAYQQQSRPANQQGFHNQRHTANQQSSYGQDQTGSANQNEGNKAESVPYVQQTANQPAKSKPTSVVTPFVPLQVTRKQTPQKNRKESVTDDSCLKEDTESSPNTDLNVNGVSGACSSGASNSQDSGPRSVTSARQDSHTQGQTTPPKTPKERPAPSSAGKSAKKSKRRLAANFGNAAD